MKIAILTQPLKSNYGGIIQAFALQQALKDLGHTVTTIDRQYKAQPIIRKAINLTKYLILLLIDKKKAFIFKKSQQDQTFKNMISFVRQRIKISEPIKSTEDLQKHFSENTYDAVVVGSDQTWRPIYSPNIFNFYLDFLQDLQIKRITYATSFGVDTWEYSKTQTLKCRDLAKKFDAISVRELSAVNLCEQYLKVSAEPVLDPTLLLNADDYLDRLNINKNKKPAGGLLTYILDNNSHKRQAITTAAQILNITPFSSKTKCNPDQSGGELLNDYTFPNVEDWIESFYDADFVLTDSFHGCVFSIIFNKPFLAIGNDDRGLARFNSLLKIFNLEDRLIGLGSQINREILTPDIDWLQVNKVIKERKENSLNFLKRNLSGN
ncbi:polysaccharide pyruvyl transferase family protein [Pseudomonas sp. MAP12]|uniref:Polysaccharide pyruvyl transferase family protein n=1 Tax=Geopseudomonas aromaticivorans TaxID=2849492 RepID=A0ABS6MVW7_9GAMM|nr:polysaccharide pyruvyl transferase family protein [Pseudomonas aromaticivorans]